MKEDYLEHVSLIPPMEYEDDEEEIEEDDFEDTYEDYVISQMED